jgi:capsular exopolysaccharide synthesis family protein
VQAIRQHWLIVVVLVVLATGAAAIYSYTATKQYEAATDIQITPIASGNNTFSGFSVFQQPLDGSSAVVLAARVLGSWQMYKAAYSALGSDGNGVSISVSPLSQADLVQVQATSSDPARAATAANTFARVAVAARRTLFQQQLLTRIAQIQSQIAAIPVNARSGNFQYATFQQELATLQGYLGADDPTVSPLSSALPPSSPTWPRPVLSTLIAFLAALFVGIAVAVGLEVVNPRISSEDDLQLEAPLPVLGRIPRLRRRVARRYMLSRGRLPAHAWSGYRTAAAMLARAGEDGGYPKSILVTSAGSAEGKTMTAANLAIALSAANLNVVLVDADLHRPMVGTVFNLPPVRHDLSRLLTGNSPLDSVLVPAPGYAKLRLLPSHPRPIYDFHLMEGGRLEALLAKLEKICDVVVFDSPPLVDVAEALVLADVVDTVIVSVRIGRTRRDLLARLRELLSRRGITPLGYIVTTRSRTTAAPGSYGYGYEIPNTYLTKPPVGAGSSTNGKAAEPTPKPRARAET